ncbi:MAG: LysR family transcriptional regulator [Verrucomicrobia bacterium]|nr:MAG: LysR family transcriptional regulator [Verrucomicrobiota bacterium]
MELRHVRYFVAVAEDLNFRRAAERLRVAQPSLSAQVKALELELGVRLLDRTTRRVKLTPSGRAWLEEARSLLAAATRVQESARRVRDGLVGSLRVGVLSSSANAWLGGILGRFRTRHPGVQFSLFDLGSTEQLRRLRSGELDVGVLRPPASFPELEAVIVEASRYVLAMPAGHPLVRRRRIAWTDFHGQPLVMMHPSIQHGFYDAFLAACATAGARPLPAQYANDIQTKLWLISAGFGVSPTTATLAEVQRPGLVFRELPEGLPPVYTALVHRRHDADPVIAAFRDAVLGAAVVTVPPAGAA